MSKPDTATIEALRGCVPTIKTSEFRGQLRAVVPAEQIFKALQLLKEERGFDFLADITCVDYLHYRGATDRFGLVYVLTNTVTNEQLIVRTFLNEPDLMLPSVTSLWEGADWMEREVWDMFGIRFDGHPDLRRILLPEEFVAFPLRKDYPLQGRGERHNFPVITRDSA
jgi:NADH-quinone oxidoreductase subunit C